MAAQTQASSNVLSVQAFAKSRVTTLQTMWNSLMVQALLPMLSVTHIMPVLVLMSVVGVGMQRCTIRNQNEMHKLNKVRTVLKTSK